MAQKQNLRLTLRERSGNRVWKHQPLDVFADPEDLPTLAGYVVEMARDSNRADRGNGEPWWASEYAANVHCLDETWRKDFEVFGGGA